MIFHNNDTEIDDEHNNELAEQNLRKFRNRIVPLDKEPLYKCFGKGKAAETSTINTSCKFNIPQFPEFRLINEHSYVM